VPQIAKSREITLAFGFFFGVVLENIAPGCAEKKIKQRLL